MQGRGRRYGTWHHHTTSAEKLGDGEGRTAVEPQKAEEVSTGRHCDRGRPGWLRGELHDDSASIREWKLGGRGTLQQCL